jgi:hypothetical protein
MPTVSPCTVLGDISVTPENRMSGGSTYMRSKQSINVAIHRQPYTTKGYASKSDNLANIPQRLQEATDGNSSLALNDTVISDDPSPSAKRLLVFISQHVARRCWRTVAIGMVCEHYLQFSSQHSLLSDCVHYWPLSPWQGCSLCLLTAS